MAISFKNLAVAGLCAAAMVGAATPSNAQDPVNLTFSSTVAENHYRATMLDTVFGACLGDGFNFEAYHGATLFEQGTELLAMQRGNLDMAPVAISNFYNQVPESNILSASYVFSSYEHMREAWESGVLDDLLAAIEEKANVKVLEANYIGTRQVNLRGDNEIMTPEDLAGVKLRMPGGEVWQFIGTALGANPTPVAFTEVYTALQTGAVDGQDNPFTGTQRMKFYEVTDQIVLTNHLVSFDLFTISKSTWDALSEDQQATVQDCANQYREAFEGKVREDEDSLRAFFEGEGLRVYDPDRAAFRSHVLAQYAESPLSSDWPEGLIDAISELAPE